MKNILIAVAAALLTLTACQKEPEFTDVNNPSGGGTGTVPLKDLLTRAVEVDGADSTVLAYSYNASGRLQSFVASGTAASALTFKIVRNAAGAIVQTVISGDDLVAIGIDSLVTTYVYNASTSRYTYSRTDIDLGGIAISDSTVFAYDGSGNITTTTSYGKVSGTPYSPASRTDYTYSNGNVATQKDYDYTPLTSSYDLVETATYTYDAKTNALKLGAEGILLGMPTTVGNNNATVVDYVDAADPANNFTNTSTLTYNSINKPNGGTRVQNPGALTYTLRFYYN